MMRSVDCWRLLGVAPGATVEEVRAAYLRRVRDVHPDSGGTGDGLTMGLLREARDEALALAGADGGGRSGDQRPAEARTAVCHVCRCEFPRPQLVRSRVPRGFRGRPAAGHVLMCFPCQVEVEARYAKAATRRLVIATLAILAAMLIAILALARA